MRRRNFAPRRCLTLWSVLFFNARLRLSSTYGNQPRSKCHWSNQHLSKAQVTALLKVKLKMQIVHRSVREMSRSTVFELETAQI